MTITEFLSARIAEDEAQANRSKADVAMNPNSAAIPASWVNGVADRALAECEAKRQIVEEATSSAPDFDYGEVDRLDGSHVRAFAFALRALAAIYADHRDYRDEWRHEQEWRE